MTSLLLTATTAAGIDPAGLAALAVIAVLGWRLVLIAAFPYTPHRPCRGAGTRWNGRYFRPCHGCHGTGRRLRLARRVWNWTRPTDTTDSSH